MAEENDDDQKQVFEAFLCAPVGQTVK